MLTFQIFKESSCGVLTFQVFKVTKLLCVDNFEPLTLAKVETGTVVCRLPMELIEDCIPTTGGS